MSFAAFTAIAAPPPNDDFANRIVLQGAIITTTGSTVDATAQAGEPQHWPSAAGKSAWWSWTAPNSAPVTITTSNSTFDTVMGVYTGSTLATLSVVATNDDFTGGIFSGVTFNSSAGTTYHIAVDGFVSATPNSGAVTLNINNSLTTSVTLITPGSTWKYLDDGSDQGTAWAAPGYVDTTWASGPAQLGYGDGDEATQVQSNRLNGSRIITTYFRKAFNASGAFSSGTVRVVRDDGVIVYLNGTPIMTNNMGNNGPYTFTNLAVEAIGNAAENTFVPTNFPGGLIANGNNVIAVEIHQQSLTSSDISFDLELVAVPVLANNPPSVTVTSPANGATFASPANITINANAFDNEGSVTNVSFFQGTTLVGRDTTHPYSFTWSNVIAGSYALRAVATDNNGVNATSGAVNVTVTGNAPASVALTSPADGATFISPANITLEASAADPDGTVSRVEFFQGTSLLGQDTSSPYTFAWNNVANGSYALRAVAVDNSNARSTSSVVNITVKDNTAPTVSISSPANNASFSAPANITINATASDLEGSVTLVEFFANNAKIGEDPSSPYSFAWNNVPAGNYGLTVVGTDNTGSRGTSGVVNVTVTSASTGTNVFIPFNAVWKYLDDGSDQGTAWVASGFNDSTWPSGPAQLGYSFNPAEQDEATLISFGPDPNNKYITTYFRRTFTVNDPASFTNLSLLLLRDDGGVVYLNGQEVFRSPNMPLGPILFNQPCNNPTGENTIDSANLNGFLSLLQAGANVLAVEIHQQSGNSSDMSFDLQLAGVASGPPVSNAPPVANITSPANGANIVAPTNVTIQATASDPDGTVSQVEFFVNNASLGVDTTSPFSFSWAPNPGNYTLRAVATDNGASKGTSAVVSVVVSGTVNQRPTVVINTPANNSTFNAPTDVPITVTAQDADGSVSRVEYFRSGVKVGESTSSPFSFTWNNALVGTFQLTAVASDNFNAQGTSSPVSVTFTSAAPTTIVAFGSTWKYLDDGSDQGIAWSQPGYDDSLWLEGPAELGYGDGDETTVVSFGPFPNNKYVTTYFRQNFSVANPTAYSFLTVRLKRDDGAIVYLNGQEVFRSNFQQGQPVDYLTFAFNAGDDGENIFTNNVSTNFLVAGQNVIAVEVHQNTASSTDLTMDLELIGNTGAINNNPPSVAISSPGNDSTYTEPAVINVSASASDSDGTITKVEFFASGTKIGEDTSSPFGLSWGPVPVGNYNLTALATDNIGSVGTSTVVRVFVTSSSAPTIAGQIPAPGNVSSLTQIALQFSEPVDGVNAGDLLLNGVPATSVTGGNANYTFSFPQPPEGIIQISFADGHGIADRETPPKPLDVTSTNAVWQYNLVDSTPPTVVLTSPTPGATVKSLNEIQVTFSEPVANVNASDLRINGVAATQVNGYGAGPYRFEFAQPVASAVTVAWAAGHGIRDFAAAQNAFAGGSWNYTLNTNLVASQIVINEIMFHPTPSSTTNEFIEIYNRGSNTINLTGWKFTRGVNFTFPAVSLAPGRHLAVAANLAAFNARYPGNTNVVGPWVGFLSNTGEDIQLEDAEGNNVDTVEYWDEGDWAIRVANGQGWLWRSEADGLGRSLELCNPALAGNNGQNWKPSLGNNGTPGAQNSVYTNNVAPLILEPTHTPAVPRSTDNITFTARIVDELTSGLTVRVWQRDASTTTPPSFSPVQLNDSGLDGDIAAGDGIYSGRLADQINGTIIEYWFEAIDQGGRIRTWPASAQQANQTFAQTCNALLQVNEEVYPGAQPMVRLIMTATEYQNFLSAARSSTAEFNLTLTSTDGNGTDVRHNLGARYRGASSEGQNPPTFRINVPHDRKWNGNSEYNLNSQYTYAQILGAGLAEKSALPAAHVRAVQLRVNGVNWGTPTPGDPDLDFNPSENYGTYALQEVMNGDWADRVFPDDGDGNSYRAGRPDTSLRYLGTNPGSYSSTGYSKESNTSENDWTDLINLTFVLSNAVENTYFRQVGEVANIEGWILYFAACQMMEYSETALCNGVGDDYSLYRGVKDPRFILMPHDFDTIFGLGENGSPNPNENIFNMTALPTIARFMRHPEITPLYYRALKRLADTVFEPTQFNPFVDSLLGEFVPTTTLDSIKNFNLQRRNYVLSQIPLNLSVNVTLPVVNGFYQTTSSSISLNGQANVLNTYSVRVNGAFAQWTSSSQGTWTMSGITLRPGLNTITIQALDGSNNETERNTIVVWYDDGSTGTVAGTISSSTTLNAAGGPYVVSGASTVSAGATLTIEPGTTLYFAQGASLTVNGRLLAEGNANQRIRFTRAPGTANTWGGIRFVNTTLDNRITYADIDFASTADPITAQNSTILVDNVVFTGTTRTVIDLNNSSAIIRNSVFPTIVNNETIHGQTMPPGGYAIIESNYFGGTTGYSDIIDFTGGKRPGPILQVMYNTFSSGSDDVLDLDGTDAHIEGNLFMNVHQDAVRDSSGNAIATDNESAVTVARNVFFDVDHALLLKNGATAIFQNNTVMGIRTNAPAEYLAAVINFNEPNRPGVTNGGGAVLDGNIFWNVDANRHFLHLTPAVSLTVNRSILQGTNHPGIGNLNLDPMFVNTNSDLHLADGSPAIGTGPNGLDMGAYVPQWVVLTGEPVSPTSLTTATLDVYGAGISHYRYSLDGGPYGAETPIATPISLSGLSSGPHQVSVIGKNSASVWQSLLTPTKSKIWVIKPGFPPVVINEVLAKNNSAVPVGSRFPDLIELYNPSSSPVSLASWGITDEPDNPFKFRFPTNAVINAGQYLILYADAESTPVGHHLGFSLNGINDDVFLTDASGLLVDSIEFGLQLDNLSIGRLRNQSWALTVPTLGAANIAARTGDESRLKINEWLADGLTPYPDDFIELFNPNTQPVALGGLFLTDSIAGTRTRHEIAPLSFIGGGGFLAFIADGNTSAGADHVDFQLAAEGGSIGLYQSNLQVIDSIVYGPQTTDISQGRRPNGAETLAFFDTPTPGAPNPALVLPGTTVVLNEILAENVTRAEVDGSTPDWVELFNPTGSSINLADMSLTDDAAFPRRYVFPSATIPSQGFYIIRFDPDQPVSATNTGFGLKASGGSVFLYDKLAVGGSLLSAVNYGVQAPDFSVGRVPDGSGAWVLTLPTRRAANITQALASTPNALRVNEWMAAPNSGDDWFEIFNSGSQPVALGGLQLRDRNNIYTIPDLSFIGIGLYGFQRFEADGQPQSGPDHVNFSLSASGEPLSITTGAGVVIDTYSFGEQSAGVSEGRLPDGTTNIVKFPTTASPEASNYLPLTNVVVSEVLSHSDPPFEDAIELRNLTASPVNIGGWYISDARNSLRKYRIPTNTTIAAHSFKVFYESQFNNSNDLNIVPFSLNSARGDEVFLSQATGAGILTGYRDSVDFGPAENAVSFGRYVGSNGLHFTALSQRTFGFDNPENVQEFRNGAGKTNAYPLVGPIVISEIMYHPAENADGSDNVRDEYIELHNITSFNIPLYHINFPTNTWRLRDAVSFTFPPNVTIPAGGHLLVVSFDPVNDPASLAAFRSRYAVSPSAAILGPYTGKLDNGGESVELVKPDAPQQAPDPDVGFVPSILVDKVRYFDSDPWPLTADGGGHSLHRISVENFGNDFINWTASAPTPGPQGAGGDTDGDGMPDAWEDAYSLNKNNANDAGQDADNDGATNLEEYRAGTDPRSASSALRVEITYSGIPTVQFNAALDKTYTIEYRDNLTTATWTKLTDIPAGPPRVVQHTDVTAPAGGRYYRLRTPQTP